jgi:hypothetical protein
LLFIFILSLLSTLINPYGINLHKFIISHFMNNQLLNVTEYIPFELYSKLWWTHIIMGILILVSTVILVKKGVFRTNLKLILVLLFLFVLTFAMRRYAWPGYYILSIFLSIIPLNITSQNRIKILPLACIFFILTLTLSGFSKLPLNQFTSMNWQKYCLLQNFPCSSESAQFLKKHMNNNKIFTFYDWGGWLIWNYPDIKPSIDGRMTLWKDKNGYSAFTEYGMYIGGLKNIDHSQFDLVYIPSERFPLSLQLSDLISQNKWKLVYENDNAIIVERIKK